MADEIGIVEWDGVRARAAFEELAPEIAAVTPERLLKVNLDVPKAAGTAMVKLPGILGLRSEIQGNLRDFNVPRLERLGTYALALFYANGAHLAASKPAPNIAELNARGLKLRRLMLLDAETQAERGRFDTNVLSAIREGNGYLDLGQDLMTLVNLYRNGRVDVPSQSALSLEELEQAEVLAAALLRAAQDRGEPSTPSKTNEQRDRVFTLFMEAYNDARRAALYLKPEHEADRIAPSLYAGKRGKREDESAEPAPLGSPSEGSPTVGAPLTGAPSNSGAAAGTPAAASTTAGFGGRLDPALTKVGMPDSPPFTE